LSGETEVSQDASRSKEIVDGRKTDLDLSDDQLGVEISVLDTIRHSDEQLSLLSCSHIRSSLRLSLKRQALEEEDREEDSVSSGDRESKDVKRMSSLPP